MELCTREDCVGCMACYQKCPHKSIDIVEEKGFYYPLINSRTCKECGICMNTCPVLNIKGHCGNTHKDAKECFATWSKDDNIRMGSSSGGIFSELSRHVISKGGIVYGAAWDDNLVLRHTYATNLDELLPLRRSKYVQSDVSTIFSVVKKSLQEGKLIMFVGTPCQVAGLHAYLNYKEYENLLLVDILCQGVPSPVLFKKYIKEFEEKHHKKVVDVIFRSKDAGWRCGLLLLLLCEDGSKYTCKYGNNAFYRAFITEHNMRPSCYNCHFKPDGQGYYGDLLIADFWRIGTKIPFNVKGWEKGVSAVVIETPKGKDLLSKIEYNIDKYTRTWSEFSTNGGLRKSHKPTCYRECLSNALNESSAENQQKYYPYGYKSFILQFIQLHTKQSTFRKIMKIVGK